MFLPNKKWATLFKPTFSNHFLRRFNFLNNPDPLTRTRNFLLLLVGGLAVLNACNKVNDPALVDAANPTSNVEVQERNTDWAARRQIAAFYARHISTADKNAFEEQITDPYDTYGKAIFDHLHVHSGRSPFDYVASDIRAKYRNATVDAATTEAAQYNSVVEMTGKKYAEGILTEALFQTYQQLDDAVHNLDPNATFAESWAFLRARESEIKNSTALTAEEKELPLSLLSILRGMIKVEYAHNRVDYWPLNAYEVFDDYPSEVLPVEDRVKLTGCVFGRKLQCFWDRIGKDHYAAAEAILKLKLGGLNNSGGGNNNGGNGGSSGSGGGVVVNDSYALSTLLKILKASTPAQIYKVIQIFNDPDCRCDAEDEILAGTEDPCREPEALWIVPTGCSTPNIAQVVVHNAGTNAGPYEWVITISPVVTGERVLNAQGDPLPPGANKFEFVTSEPYAYIKQLNPNVKVGISVRNLCTGDAGEKLELFVDPNFVDITNSPGAFQTLLASTNIPPKRCDQITYSYIGTGLLFGWTNVSWWTSHHGQILNSNNEQATVKWVQPTVNQNGQPLITGTPIQGQVSVNATNTCSQLQSAEHLQNIAIGWAPPCN